VALVGADRVGQVDRGPAAGPLLRRDRGCRAHRRHDVRDLTWSASVPGSASSWTSPSSSPCPYATTSPSAGPTPPRPSRGRRPGRGGDEFIRDLPAVTTQWWESGATRCPGRQRQRIGIARTLLVNPPILVLDDATSAIGRVRSSSRSRRPPPSHGGASPRSSWPTASPPSAWLIGAADGGREVDRRREHAELFCGPSPATRGAGPGRGARAPGAGHLEDGGGPRAGADAPRPDVLEPIDVAVGGGGG